MTRAILRVLAEIGCFVAGNLSGAMVANDLTISHSSPATIIAASIMAAAGWYIVGIRMTLGQNYFRKSIQIWREWCGP